MSAKRIPSTFGLQIPKYPYNVVMRNKRVLATLGFVLLIVYIIYSSMGLAEVSCEVCIKFRGRTECRTAQTGS